MLLSSCVGPSPYYDEPLHQPEPVDLADLLDSPCPYTSMGLYDDCFGGYGHVYLIQDGQNFEVHFVPSGDWLVATAEVYAGDSANVPFTPFQAPNLSQFPYQDTYEPPVTSATITIPMASLDSCFRLFTHACLVQVDPCDPSWIIAQANVWAGSVQHHECEFYAYEDYCIPHCDCTGTGGPGGGGGSGGGGGGSGGGNDTTCVIDPGDFRTQTQGGWGSIPSGSNPGVYLHSNFAGAFPNGMTIGCNHTIEFTSAQAITDFLPQGGTPAPITTSYVDPTTQTNVFAGQVTALSLSVRFDQYDPNFGSSSTLLKDLVIGSGPLAGQTVEFALMQANNKLGGCISVYSISDLNSTISSINQNFVDGTMDNGYLICP